MGQAAVTLDRTVRSPLPLRAGPAGRHRSTLAPNVTLLEYQHDPHQLARILASSDAFVHDGDQETCGLIALEAFERDRAAIGRSARRRAEAHSWDVAFTQLIGRYWRLMAASGLDAQVERHACG